MKVLLWILTPLIYWTLHQLVPDVGRVQLAIDPVTALIIAATLTTAGGIGSGIIAGQSSGPSFTDSDRALLRRPTTGGALPDALLAEQLVALGVPPDAIAQELVFRNIEDTAQGAGQARVQRRIFGLAQSRLAAGDEAGAQRLLDQFNNRNASFGVRFDRTTGAGAIARIENGQITFEFGDPQIQSVIANAREFGAGIQANRFQTLADIVATAANLPDVSGPAIEERERAISQVLLSDLDRDVADRTEQLLAQGQRFGFNPGRAIGDLEETRAQEAERIRSEGALQRAVALLGGELGLSSAGISARQGALVPPNLAASLDFTRIGTGADTAALSFAQQLAIAGAEAEAARNTSLANIFQSTFGDLAGIASLGGLQQNLSSKELQEELGLIPGPSNRQPISIRG